ncbi:MAG: hypothetical protein IH975_04390 [Nitrospinae bacterium]|nr:hypothetical protein [Nitrospinota bacterium]
MKGKRIIVRAYGNKPLVRFIWEAKEKVVFVTNEEQLGKLVKGAKDALMPVGFPPEDVFEHDPLWIGALEDGNGDQPNWSKLKLWRDSN